MTTATVEYRIKQCIINRLDLDVTPEEIDDAAPLFGEGLGLDSIDALELVIAVGKEFGVEIDDDDMEHFGSINSIAAFVRSKNPAL
jgi:acyl carrier protein